MKRTYILGGVTLLLLIGTAVFALQQKTVEEPVIATNEVAPKAVAATGSACGSGCGQSSGCGGAAGGCSGEELDPAASAQKIEGIKTYLYSYYEKKGIPGVSIEVDDQGCHQEATVTAGGKVIERLSIQGTRITPIT
jgi:hypothetical protein